jgi:sulfite dehydrogenase
MNAPFSRRDFIKLIGAGAAGAGLPAALSGCATTPAPPPKPVGRVIVIGGGYGGATAARYIRMWSAGRIEVFLIERNTQFVSCPLSNLVLGGSRTIESLTLGYEKLRESGVQVIRDEVTGINVERKRVQLRRIEDLPYDRLVVSPGVDFLWKEIPALDNADAQKLILHAWRAGPDTVALRKQLEAMPDGGTFLLSIPKAPYRCPPGPYERVCQVASYFSTAKPRSRILVLDGNEDIVS